ncbi:transcriptional repressor LexA [Deinococcus peraridilitoris]|uniref:SOS regulatory protein LexA n=1 Tax=Deinococcus peraridilitoris (strain DSM 19664 / LMG 22246 / CIP 109416 / KR-200) TaxID=937777 RepID=L0A5G7_DEIPD|nr:transcriptional repressor LexA [Deinococcus peraridilitoris]AFZ68432.1 SOS regulatory protein LexA [Deinococcus peraridilitoris DSM 19664]
MPPRITERRKDILRLIARMERELGRSISASELSEALRMTKQALADHLTAFEALGLVTRHRGRYGLLQLTRQGARVAGMLSGVPVVGRVAAGQPILAEQNIEREIDRVRDLLRLGDQDFFLRVQGDSMTGAGIHDGDLVAICASAEVLDGEIAAVILPGENTGTLKRFYRQGERVLLRSENDHYEPMEFPAEDVQVQGRYAGHIALSRPRRSLGQD